jgi:hypothetical protein
MNSIIEQVRPETAELLAVQARTRGLSVDDYLKSLLETMNRTEAAPAPASVEEFMAAMESLAEDEVEPLPRDFSREDIYFPED